MFIMSDKYHFLCDQNVEHEKWNTKSGNLRTQLRGPKFKDRHAKSIDALRASIIIGYASD
jgi:hypothetical protein